MKRINSSTPSTRKHVSSTTDDRRAATNAAILNDRRRGVRSSHQPGAAGPSNEHPQVTAEEVAPSRHDLLREQVWKWALKCVGEALGDDQTRRLDDIMAFENTMEVVDEDLATEIKNLERVIGKFETILREDGVCKICFRLLGAPFTAKCGHTYCGQCFRSTIETQLTTSLREFGTICEGPAPRISDGPAALAKRITDRGHHMYVAADIFSYACPSCRQKSQHPPIYSRKLGLFILAVKEKLGPQVVGDLQVAQEGPNDAGFFKPFFL